MMRKFKQNNNRKWNICLSLNTLILVLLFLFSNSFSYGKDPELKSKTSRDNNIVNKYRKSLNSYSKKLDRKHDRIVKDYNKKSKYFSQKFSSDKNLNCFRLQNQHLFDTLSKVTLNSNDGELSSIDNTIDFIESSNSFYETNNVKGSERSVKDIRKRSKEQNNVLNKILQKDNFRMNAVVSACSGNYKNKSVIKSAKRYKNQNEKYYKKIKNLKQKSNLSENVVISEFSHRYNFNQSLSLLPHNSNEIINPNFNKYIDTFQTNAYVENLQKKYASKLNFNIDSLLSSHNLNKQEQTKKMTQKSANTNGFSFSYKLRPVFYNNLKNALDIGLEVGYSISKNVTIIIGYSRAYDNTIEHKFNFSMTEENMNVSFLVPMYRNIHFASSLNYKNLKMVQPVEHSALMNNHKTDKSIHYLLGLSYPVRICKRETTTVSVLYDFNRSSSVSRIPVEIFFRYTFKL